MEVAALFVVNLKCQFSRSLRYTNSYVHTPYGIASAEYPPHVAASGFGFTHTANYCQLRYST